MRIQAKELMFTEQMTVRRSRGIGTREQVTQQCQGIAQALESIGRLTVGPEQGGQLAAGMHATFDPQVKQQGLRLAQGKRETTAMMKNSGRAEHRKTEQIHTLSSSA